MEVKLNNKPYNRELLNEVVLVKDIIEEYYYTICWLVDSVLINFIIKFSEIWCITGSTIIETVLLFFKYDWLNRFIICIDIVVYDMPNKLYRYTIIYYLLSIQYNIRISIATQIKRKLPSIRSISLIYKSADWSEREAWDIFGIKFIGHNDLRRILTDYGFRAFPLRKDYPLTGYFEVYYNYLEQTVIYTPVTLSQEFRVYIFENPWIKELIEKLGLEIPKGNTLPYWFIEKILFAIENDLV